MKVAVIGTGNIGGTLGRAFAGAGHDVTFGSRSPGDDQVAQGTAARVSDVAGALDGADAVVLAIPGPLSTDCSPSTRRCSPADSCWTPRTVSAAAAVRRTATA
jgi:predicted dinucleotide-binding enzyme